MKLLHIQLLLLWKETVIILSSVFDGMYPPQRMHILSLFTDHKGPESPSERQRENMPSSHTLPPLLPRLITPRLRDVVFKITSMAITAGCERTMLNGYRIPYTLSHGGMTKGGWRGGCGHVSYDTHQHLHTRQDFLGLRRTYSYCLQWYRVARGL